MFIYLIFLGKVNFFYSVPIGIIMIFGATLGAKTAVTKGTKFIKPMFLICNFNSFSENDSLNLCLE